MRRYSNVAFPQPLSSGINSVATLIEVPTTTGYPDDPVNFPFLLGIERGTANEELVRCVAKTATTFTVERGFDGTTAVDHAPGVTVEHCSAAIELREAGIVRVSTSERNLFASNERWEGRMIWNETLKRFENYLGATLGWGALLPPGAVIPYAGPSAPGGWLLCNGQAVSRTDYAGLFGVIGVAFGNGDGSTTFNVPDMRERFPVGVGPGAQYDLGDTGGAETVALTVAQLASHNHSGPSHTHSGTSHTHQAGNLSTSNAGSHAHGSGSYKAASSNVANFQEDAEFDAGGLERYRSTGSNNVGAHTHDITGSSGSAGTHNHNVTGNTATGGTGNTGSGGGGNTSTVGSGQAHENRPPFLALNFIIRA